MAGKFQGCALLQPLNVGDRGATEPDLINIGRTGLDRKSLFYEIITSTIYSPVYIGDWRPLGFKRSLKNRHIFHCNIKLYEAGI
mgnify:CR=1 FL=1